jgi:small subunit ribosomal protein S4
VLFYNLKLAKSIKQARQLIVHEFVYIGDKRVTSPGYFVKREEEKLITIKKAIIENGGAANAEQGA